MQSKSSVGIKFRFQVINYEVLLQDAPLTYTFVLCTYPPIIHSNLSYRVDA